jgi:peptidoglycan/xylan/chitin deacetylase (PgdA/CDA1 family)
MIGRTMRWILSLVHRPGFRDGSAPPRLTILRHHRVYAAGERPLYRLGVAEDVFAAQLEALAGAGLQPITVGEGLRRLERGDPGHCVALSFDDGYADNVWRALPRLQAAGARASFYLTAGLMEERRAPWWDELAFALERSKEPRLSIEFDGRTLDLPLAGRRARCRALASLLGVLRVHPAERERRLAALRLRLGVSERAPCELATWDTATALVRSGMEVGAHTMTHPHLTTLDLPGQAREIGESAELIERRLGVRPAGLAYPGGDHDPATMAAAESCGLEYAVTTRAGDNRPGAGRYSLLRRGFHEGHCTGPTGRFSRRLALAELDGAFDRLRGMEAAS